MTAPLISGLVRERAAHLRQPADRQDAGSAPAHPLVRLQQQAGNAAVSRLVQRILDGSIQRNGEMDEEELQAKHDPAIRRQAEPGEEEEMALAAHDPESQEGQVGLEGGALPDRSANMIDSMRGAGSSLDDGVRAAAEPALGLDLSGVRVHHNSTSDSLARGMTARAFTSGSDIFLRGDANPGDSKLMAHELTHVAQQSSGLASPSGQRMSVGPADDPLEHEADRVAEAVTSGVASREIEDQ